MIRLNCPKVWLIVFIGLIFSSPGWSNEAVPGDYRSVAAENGIPYTLLYAIALTVPSMAIFCCLKLLLSSSSAIFLAVTSVKASTTPVILPLSNVKLYFAEIYIQATGLWIFP